MRSVKPSVVTLTPDQRLSALHATYVVATSTSCIDERTEKALVKNATQLNARLLSSTIEVADFWPALFAAAAGKKSIPKSCESALLAAGCSELQIDQTGKAVSRLLMDCVSTFEKRFPKLTEQLDLRAKPLKSRWEERGPGLLIQIAEQIWSSDPPADWWPTKTQGLLLQPLRGGDGGFDVGCGRFWMEALLTDAASDVPEILRVAWLTTQLAIGKYTSRSKSSGESAELPWNLGTVPIVLNAGLELDLVQEPLPIDLAMHLWRLGDDDTAEVLADWYAQWQQTQAPMPVALKALDKMLEPIRQVRPMRNIDLRELEDE